LHAACGLYVWCIALTIACTGLVYSTLWGSGYALAAKISGVPGSREPTQSRSPPEAANLSVDELIATVRQYLPGASITVNFPRDRNGAVMVFGSWPIGPVSQRVVVLDRVTGEVLEDRSNRDSGILAWWLTWNYPLHIGSVLGTPTKVIWLAACLGLITLPVTGVWMWWQRRPPGQAGFPARPTSPAPRWLFRVIVALCVLMPMFGISVLAILLGEGAARWRNYPGSR
jgi:uncharacterized iron-regulated membrane protein